MLSLAAVFLGGGIGASLRYGASLLFSSLHLNPWLATLTVNILGCLVFFLICEMFSGEWILSDFLKVGLLGSLTTFSTFAFEVHQLFSAGRYREAALCLLLNVGLGIGIGFLVLGKKLI